MVNSLEYRNLYVKDKTGTFILLKEAPFIWTDKMAAEIEGRDFEFRDPLLKMKWLTQYSDLDWSTYTEKNLKPIVSYLHRCVQWASLNGLSSVDKKNLIKREFENFNSKPRFPFDPISPFFQEPYEVGE